MKKAAQSPQTRCFFAHTAKIRRTPRRCIRWAFSRTSFSFCSETTSNAISSR
jgi:hypothetical protein